MVMTSQEIEILVVVLLGVHNGKLPLEFKMLVGVGVGVGGGGWGWEQPGEAPPHGLEEQTNQVVKSWGCHVSL